jgi:hypothetical protein
MQTINIPPPPPRKEFKAMQELIGDAIKYDRNDETKLTNETLKTLINYVHKFIIKNKPQE